MNHLIISADSYFDGLDYHNDGPYLFTIENGTISAIIQHRKNPVTGSYPSIFNETDVPTYKAPFIMPGLVEAHCHLFLDGGELNFKARSEHLKLPVDEMLETARRNVNYSLERGITLIRDAGDKHGVNLRIRDESASRTGAQPVIRAPGLGIRRPKRYGSFMAAEVDSKDEIVETIDRLSKNSDDLKIILTGIIDFEAGCVKGEPQFDLDSLKLITQTATSKNLLTFAHCSGEAGLKLAVEAGVDSIEHGFFMSRDILERMADKGIAWVPTFSPVHFQWARPEFAGWDKNTLSNLNKILESHRESLALAGELGVPIVAGSDAGSHGVQHGDALINEIFFLLESGLPLESVLRAAISTPRMLWGEESANLVEGNKANLVALGGDPFLDTSHLWNVSAVFKDRLHLAQNTQKQKGVVLPQERSATYAD